MISSRFGRAAVIEATPRGFELAERTPHLRDVIDSVVNSSQHPEDYLQRDPRFSFLGSGVRSHAYAAGDVAVKLSSRTTGMEAYNFGSTTPENLLRQYRVLRALGKYLEGTTDEIITPRQHFAIQPLSHRHSLMLQEYMHGWQPLRSWLLGQNPGNTQVSDADMPDIIGPIHQRLTNALSKCPFRLAINDLLKQPPGRMNCGNVLIPRHTEDPTTARLCIIDQPSVGISGQLGGLAAIAYGALPPNQPRPAHRPT